MSDITSLWNELEKLLATIAPTVLPTLNPPATDRDLDLLESKTGLILPQGFRQSLKIHNGQSDPSRLELLTEHGILLSCEQIAEAWCMLCKILDEVNQTADGSKWWNKSYLPIADYEGDYLCIDLTPGSYGSIHLHVHDSTIERDIAATYTAWLSNARDVFRDRRFGDSQGFIDFWSFDTTT